MSPVFPKKKNPNYFEKNCGRKGETWKRVRGHFLRLKKEREHRHLK